VDLTDYEIVGLEAALGSIDIKLVDNRTVNDDKILVMDVFAKHPHQGRVMVGSIIHIIGDNLFFTTEERDNMPKNMLPWGSALCDIGKMMEKLRGGEFDFDTTKVN